ncbi:MAG TPA: hypothetical protein VGZ26_12000 [Pirellulales bacterium]|jgi:hypothetical protein|nr:hypothetical protein [Pirellulales bacterium]
MSPTGQNDAVFVANKTAARFVLMLFLGVTIFLVAVTFSSMKSGFADAPSRGPGDVALYRAEADRVRQGQSYYDAIAAELRSRGYPMRSIFNWRMPLPVWLIGILPGALGQGLLGLLAVALLCLSFELLADRGGVKQGLLGVALLSGALLPCVLGDLFVMPELWSGVLIALSAVCFGLKRRVAGVIVGLAALFFRELAAPYCVLCFGMAVWERRYRESVWWLLGFAAYAVFLGLHVWQVLPRIAATDTAHADGWIRFGGAGFLISTAQMNAYLLLLPQWVTAMYLSFVLLGCASWNSDEGKRISLAIALYAIAFSVAGHDFNQYWGSLTAPLYCLAACRCPKTVGQLWTAADLPGVASRRRSVSVQD